MEKDVINKEKYSVILYQIHFNTYHNIFLPKASLNDHEYSQNDYDHKNITALITPIILKPEKTQLNTLNMYTVEQDIF